MLEVYDTEPSSLVAALVNASTRAHVGTADAVLIPGFVIAGSGHLRLLLRAVGPMLASFGVEEVLANPEPALFRGATVLERNDDWSGADNAAHIDAAADRVGAFRLPKGSRDAAMLVSLAAGNYTARISGTGATTGTALVQSMSCREQDRCHADDGARSTDHGPRTTDHGPPTTDHGRYRGCERERVDGRSTGHTRSSSVVGWPGACALEPQTG